MDSEEQNDINSALKSTIESLMASHTLLQCQVEILEEALADVLEQLEYQPRTPKGFVDDLRVDAAERCEMKLAHLADSMPGMASILKASVDRMKSRDESESE